jgi:hypothetical protein
VGGSLACSRWYPQADFRAIERGVYNGCMTCFAVQAFSQN